MNQHYSKFARGKWRSIVASLLILLSFVGCNQPQTAPPGTKVTEEAEADDHDHEHGVELVLLMGRMQLFMNKLYFSGMAENTELRDFYTHEIEEVMEEIAEGNVVHEGVDISQNMEMYGVAQIEVFEEALAENNDFSSAYSNLINACNSCHMASKYPFIIIKEPTNPVFDNQVYSKK